MDADNHFPDNADCLSLDFGPAKTVNRWKQMQDCDEFVGAKYVLSDNTQYNRVLFCVRTITCTNFKV